MIARANGTPTRRAALLLLALLACAVGLLASPAGGAKLKRVATTVQIFTIDADNASGTVNSPRPECRRGRRVKLHTSTAEKKTLGAGTSDSKGRYLISLPGGAGGAVYFADVKKAIRHGRKNGHKVTFECRGAESVPAAF